MRILNPHLAVAHAILIFRTRSRYWLKAATAHTLLAVLFAIGPGLVVAKDVGPITHEGTVCAPVELVWDAWTTSEGLRSWLAPHAEIDLRVGGIMRTNYNPGGYLGDSTTIENKILSYDPMRMLAIKVHKTPQGFPFSTAVQDMWTIVYFSETESGRTHIRIIGLGFTDSDESQQMRSFFDKGNATTLTQLQQRFNSSN
jgi:uncharacterized protein YndB with AHSA1/START domain